MIVINRMACSPEFSAALDALEAGTAVRRASWPAGQLHQKQRDQIVVVRESSSIAPGWMGPSSDETIASDWQTV